MTNEPERMTRLRPWSAATYCIEVEGRLSESWVDWFASMQITTHELEDQRVLTCLIGRVRDQSELTGLLNGLADLQLPILSVRRMD